MVKISSIQRFALYIYFFSLAFEMFNIWGLGSAARFAGILYIASLLPTIWDFVTLKEIGKFLVPLFLLWTLLSLISGFYAYDNSINILDLTLLMNIFLFLVLINHERKEPKIILKGLLSYSIGIIILTVFYMLGIGIRVEIGRVTIFEENENVVGMKISICIVYLLIEMLENKLKLNRWRYLFLVPIPFLIKFMCDTGSRVATISLTLSITAAIFMIYKNHNSRKILIGFLVFILTLRFLFNYIVSQETLMNRFMETYMSGDLEGRNIIWQSVIGLIKENILFGVGETGYRLFCLKEFGDYASPHNVILEILAYTGIIGLFIYLKFIYHLIYSSYMSYKKELNLMPLLLLIPTFGFVLSGQALNVKIVWAIYALAASSILKSNRYRKKLLIIKMLDTKILKLRNENNE